MKNVDVTAPGKLLVVGIVMGGAFAVIIVAMLTNADETLITSMVGLVGTMMGYVLGNGAGAKAGFVSVPPFQPTPSRQLEVLSRIVAEDLNLKSQELRDRAAQTKIAQAAQTASAKIAEAATAASELVEHAKTIEPGE